MAISDRDAPVPQDILPEPSLENAQHRMSLAEGKMPPLVANEHSGVLRPLSEAKIHPDFQKIAEKLNALPVDNIELKRRLFGQLYPMIAAKIAEGASHRSIIKLLADSGCSFSPATFKKWLETEAEQTASVLEARQPT